MAKSAKLRECHVVGQNCASFYILECGTRVVLPACHFVGMHTPVWLLPLRKNKVAEAIESGVPAQLAFRVVARGSAGIGSSWPFWAEIALGRRMVRSERSAMRSSSSGQWALQMA